MLEKRIHDAIERLKIFEPEAGYYLAFSGGKDSVVLKTLAQMAGVKFDAHYNVTTVDPPELVRFIKDEHPDVIFERPEKTMWELIKSHGMFPTRLIRYCCAELKERGGTGRSILTGVRWAESPRRRAQWDIATPRLNNSRNKKKREEIRERYKMADNDEKARIVETCYTRGYFAVAPILDWENNEIWEFIKGEHIPYCSLYDDGFKRLGCIGCPMASKSRIKEFLRWPSYYRRYFACAEWLVENGRSRHPDAVSIMRWWLELKPDEHYPELGL